MLFYVFWLIAAALCGTLYLTVDGLHPGWIIPIVLGAFVAICLLFLLYLYLSSLCLSKKQPEHPVPFAWFTTRVSLDWFMRIFGVKIRVLGAEKLPEGPVIYVCNHRSAFDPVFIICGIRRRRMAFIAKSSVMKYPVVGPYVLRSGFLGIERESPLQSLRTINRAARYVREDGIDYGVFPEGTRSRDGRLGPFKEGAFLLAKKADAPIAVLTMEGSETAWSGLPFHRPRILIRVERVISVEEVRALDHEALSGISRDVMQKALASDGKGRGA